MSKKSTKPEKLAVPTKPKKAAKPAPPEAPAAEPVRRTYRAHVSAEPEATGAAAPPPPPPKMVAIPRPALHEALLRVGSSYDQQTKALAKHNINVTGGYLSLLVRGLRNPSVDLAKRLAKALKVPVEVVIGK